MLALIAVLLGTFAASAQTPDLTGHWLGTLNAGGVQLRVALHFEKAGATFSGKMDSLDQNANGIALTNIVAQAGAVSFDVPAAGGKFNGSLGSDGKLTGTMSQGPGKMPITFTHVTEMPKDVRPQEPKKPYPYDELEVTYENKTQGVTIAGTLTFPRNRKPAPAVLLISGSGPQDRNESVMGHKPFLVLADHLTRRGIAVLRVDDRGIGGTTGNPMTSTTLDFASDVHAGVAFLKSRPEVDAAQIGLIGHSEGGLIASIVASQSKDVAFIVLMAGTGVTGEQILYEQSAALIQGAGGSREMAAANQDMQKKMFDILRTEPDLAVAKKKITAIAGAGEAAKVAMPWFRTFLTLDPQEYLRKVTCPVLVMNGELDLQVVPKQNLPVIAKALEEAGNRDYTIVKLPKLNHLFQAAVKGTLDEYAKIEETMALVALNTVSGWIALHTR